jgi:hypothetical protein
MAPGKDEKRKDEQPKHYRVQAHLVEDDAVQAGNIIHADYAKEINAMGI